MNFDNSNSVTVIIHVGINGLLNGSNEPQIDSLLQNIGKIIQKPRSYGIKSIFISGLVYTARVTLSILEETYKRFEVFRRNNGVILIENTNLFFYFLFILYLQLTNLQLKSDIILYTNKNCYVLIIKKNMLIHINYLIQ